MSRRGLSNTNQRLSALKTRLGLILAKAVAMRVMINATGCPAPVLDRNRMNTHNIALRLSLSSVPLGLPLWCNIWASLSAFFVLVIHVSAGGRRDRDFLVQRSRFLAALKTRLGLILAKAAAMPVMINATTPYLASNIQEPRPSAS